MRLPSETVTWTKIGLQFVSEICSNPNTPPRLDAPQLKDELARKPIDIVHSSSFLHWQVSGPQPSDGLKITAYRTRSVTCFQVHTRN